MAAWRKVRLDPPTHADLRTLQRLANLRNHGVWPNRAYRVEIDCAAWLATPHTKQERFVIELLKRCPKGEPHANALAARSADRHAAMARHRTR